MGGWGALRRVTRTRAAPCLLPPAPRRLRRGRARHSRGSRGQAGAAAVNGHPSRQPAAHAPRTTADSRAAASRAARRACIASPGRLKPGRRRSRAATVTHNGNGAKAARRQAAAPSAWATNTQHATRGAGAAVAATEAREQQACPVEGVRHAADTACTGLPGPGSAARSRARTRRGRQARPPQRAGSKKAGESGGCCAGSSDPAGERAPLRTGGRRPELRAARHRQGWPKQAPPRRPPSALALSLAHRGCRCRPRRSVVCS